jgi:UDPglucose--hexose-1-phosphate uridylyltransferase
LRARLPLFMHEYRFDSLRGLTLLIAEKRAERPHLHEKGGAKKKCPFCRGNEALTGPATLELPAEKWRVRAFPNKYPFVERRGRFKKGARTAPAFGDHEVIVETARHSELFEDYSREQTESLWSAYLDRFNELSSRPQTRFVFLLKNHGADSGASIPHEHSQIVSYPFVPERVKRFAAKPCALCDLRKLGVPVFSTRNFRVIAPFDSLTAGELWVVPKKHVESMNGVNGVELLRALQECVRRVKRFSNSYNFAFINSPKGGGVHFHVQVFPRTERWGAVELGLGIYLNALGARNAAELFR